METVTESESESERERERERERTHTSPPWVQSSSARQDSLSRTSFDEGYRISRGWVVRGLYSSAVVRYDLRECDNASPPDTCSTHTLRPLSFLLYKLFIAEMYIVHDKLPRIILNSLQLFSKPRRFFYLTSKWQQYDNHKIVKLIVYYLIENICYKLWTKFSWRKNIYKRKNNCKIFDYKNSKVKKWWKVKIIGKIYKCLLNCWASLVKLLVRFPIYSKFLLSQNWILNSSEYIWIFSDFFLIFNFFFSYKKRSSHEIWICFRKKTRHYTQEAAGYTIETIRKYDSNIFR